MGFRGSFFWLTCSGILRASNSRANIGCEELKPSQQPYQTPYLVLRRQPSKPWFGACGLVSDQVLQEQAQSREARQTAFVDFLTPKGPRCCYELWGILPQIIVVIPHIETLPSNYYIGTLDPLSTRLGFRV